MTLSKPAEYIYRFLLLGKSGSGKSSTANTLMGNEDFDVDIGLSSVTKTCTFKTRELRKPKATFEIMDTPGLFDPEKSNEEIRDLIIKSLSCVCPGLHALLFVIRIGRFTPEEYDTFMQLKRLLGADYVKYTIIIFTGKDEMERRKKTLQEILDSADAPFKEILQECGGRVMALDNINQDERERQVNELLEIVHRMLKDNGDIPYLCNLQEVVNTTLKKEVADRTDERIKQDPKLNPFFNKLEEDFRQRSKSAKEHKEILQGTLTKEEVMMMQIEESKRKEQEAREELERMKQHEEMKKKEQEERERQAEEDEKKRRKEKKAEQKRQQEEERKKIDDLEKELAKVRTERKMQEELAKEKERLREEAEKKLDLERKKIEEDESKKTKEDIASGKNEHWVKKVVDGAGDVAAGAWKAVSAWVWG